MKSTNVAVDLFEVERLYKRDFRLSIITSPILFFRIRGKGGEQYRNHSRLNSLSSDSEQMEVGIREKSLPWM
jgi:hypothetical protein